MSEIIKSESQRGKVWIEPSFRQFFKGIECDEYADFLQKFLGQAFQRERVAVVSKSLTGQDTIERSFYFKLYSPKGRWKFMGRASKAKLEHRNYSRFSRLGIRCATCAGYGEARNTLGWLKGAFIITETVPNAVTMEDLFASHEEGPYDKRVSRLRAAVIQQLASFTKCLHDNGFFHRDLRFRNILVNEIESKDPKIWWIDCPRGNYQWPWLSRRRAIIKDLATLDLDAAELCSTQEKMTFLDTYLGPKSRREELDDLVQAISNYRQSRWSYK